jgi:serine/threonine protein kinase/WD40 repeat protein
MPVDAARAKSLFLAASDLADPSARGAYLERECGADAELRARVEALMRANDAADGTQTHDPHQLHANGEDSSAVLGTLIAGKYKLVEVIGEGGMGCVYMAKQTEPVQRMVAVKLIRPGMDSRGVLARFEAERQALAVMDHPNIAKILDGGLHDNRPFFVMELVKGTPITRFCDERKLTPRERLELFVSVCQAIQHAHQKGIIHRDIKPSNVLVALYDDRAVPKVIDFGVAKATGPALTDASVYTGFGAIVGTPEYMSPEQASLNNLDIDTRSDVYALGVLLYELLTGTTPVDRKQLGQAAFLEVLRIVREVEATRPSTKLSTSEALASIAANRNMEPAKLSRLMKGELDWILLKALEKDRARRYESANGFAADVQRYLAGEPVQAVPPSASYRLKKFLKRHSGPVLAAAAMVTFLIAGVAVSAWQAIVADKARQDAQAAEKQAADRGDAAVKAGEQLRDTRDELWSRLYASRCALIQSAWDAHDYGRVRELLAEQIPSAGQRDLRGFEWHYYDRQINGELRSVPVPRSCAYMPPPLSPDGTRLLRIVKRADGNWLKSFDTTTGQEMFAIREPVDRFAFISYSPDGKRFVTTVSKGVGVEGYVEARLWDATTGAEDESVPRLRFGPTLSLAGPAGKQLIYTQRPQPQERLKQPTHCWFWDGNTSHPFPHADVIYAVSADGRALAANRNGSIVVLDAESGKVLLTTNVGVNATDAGYGRAVVFSPDGRKLAVGGNVTIWDLPGGKRISEIKDLGDNLAFSPDGSLLAYRNGPDAKIVEVATGQVRRILKGHDDGISALAFSGDGKVLVVAAGDRIKHWDATIIDERTAPFVGMAGVELRVPSPEGSRIAGVDGIGIGAFIMGRDGKESQLPDAKGVKPVREPKPEMPFSLGLSGASFSPNGRRFANAAYEDFMENDKRTRRYSALGLWDVETPRRLLAEFDNGILPADDIHETHRLRMPTFSPDSRQLAALIGPPDAVVKVWDADTGHQLFALPAPPGNHLGLAFSTDGSRLGVLASSGVDRVALSLWDTSSGQLVRTSSLSLGEGWNRNFLSALAISADARRVAFPLQRDNDPSVTTPRIVRVWDTVGGDSVDLKDMVNDRVVQIVFSPDGRRIATTNGRNTVRLWDTETGAEVLRFKALGYVPLLNFTADGQALRIACETKVGIETQILDAHPRNQ